MTVSCWSGLLILSHSFASFTFNFSHSFSASTDLKQVKSVPPVAPSSGAIPRIQLPAWIRSAGPSPRRSRRKAWPMFSLLREPSLPSSSGQFLRRARGSRARFRRRRGPFPATSALPITSAMLWLLATVSRRRLCLCRLACLSCLCLFLSLFLLLPRLVDCPGRHTWDSCCYCC